MASSNVSVCASSEAHTVIKSSALEIKLNTVPGCLISFNCELT